MDFRDQLRRQLGFLERSCAEFDAGHEEEAIRIATVIRVLVHNTKSCTSLLKHLQATTINLLSTCEGAGSSTFHYYGLGVQHISSESHGVTARYAPLFDGPTQVFVPVSKWWDMVVYVLGKGERLSRRNIVLAASNKDGGAHVDSSLTPDYEALSRAGAAGQLLYRRGDERGEILLVNAHFVALRQMAYELLHSKDLLGIVR